MEHQTQAEARALEPQCGNPASGASRKAVIKLKALPPAVLVERLKDYVEWDLGNLARCALSAGASADLCWGENNAPAIWHAALFGSKRPLKALLTGGANVELKNDRGNNALHIAAVKGEVACLELLLSAGAELEVRHILRASVIMLRVSDCLWRTGEGAGRLYSTVLGGSIGDL
jgi:ankyrin repeat protein